MSTLLEFYVAVQKPMPSVLVIRIAKSESPKGSKSSPEFRLVSTHSLADEYHNILFVSFELV